jgi:hypothetical protein
MNVCGFGMLPEGEHTELPANGYVYQANKPFNCQTRQMMK